jgi:hypothetical protein
VPFLDEAVHKVAADEPSPACDQDPHPTTSTGPARAGAPRRFGLALVVALLSIFATPVDANAAEKKAIWGPLTMPDGSSAFPVYRDLGVRSLQVGLQWASSAPQRPSNPTDPSDPAYRWPAGLDGAIGEARRYGMRIMVLVNTSPGWANGGRGLEWAPRNRHYADFLTAASRRYPGVRHWMIWGEPSKPDRFQPLVEATGRRLTARQRRGPRHYARILDASYGALKRVSRRNKVIGGNTWTAGEVVPLNFIRAMRLPGGRRPRMDLYGHNPFTLRLPNLRKDTVAFGTADFSDLDALARWLDRYGYRDRRGRRMRLFLSELSIPTDHANHEFPFYVPWRVQARWLTAALRIARRWDRIYTLGYLGLYDDPPRPDGLEVNRGLITYSGERKPSYRAFRRG